MVLPGEGLLFLALHTFQFRQNAQQNLAALWDNDDEATTATADVFLKKT